MSFISGRIGRRGIFHRKGAKGAEKRRELEKGFY